MEKKERVITGGRRRWWREGGGKGFHHGGPARLRWPRLHVALYGDIMGCLNGVTLSCRSCQGSSTTNKQIGSCFKGLMVEATAISRTDRELSFRDVGSGD
ncbi:hypothetical protein GWI33_016106 [Rhynchophorus ferrugineus]|uniref:Uncharacterized protein n=1 Tax=Rhynchophorus ferrugineus TaxID=354439 RepID=A0A834M916_RHYFE|nr:hypothetical protein GWI33_016106 [Rhynchophorus ferrugineus]